MEDGEVFEAPLTARQPSVTAVLDDEDCGPRRRTIQQSSGKRRRRVSNKQAKDNKVQEYVVQDPA